MGTVKRCGVKTITRDLSRPRVQVLPGRILLEEFLLPAGLTQVEAARRMGRAAQSAERNRPGSARDHRGHGDQAGRPVRHVGGVLDEPAGVVGSSRGSPRSQASWLRLAPPDRRPDHVGVRNSRPTRTSAEESPVRVSSAGHAVRGMDYMPRAPFSSCGRRVSVAGRLPTRRPRQQPRPVRVHANAGR